MVKTIVLSGLFFLISLCSYSNIQGDNSNGDCVTYECKAEFAVDIATSFEGIKEVNKSYNFHVIIHHHHYQNITCIISSYYIKFGIIWEPNYVVDKS